MFKMSHSALIVISGVVWLAIGCMLLSLGLNFIVQSILKDNLITMKRPVIDFFASFTGGPDQGAIVLIAVALVIGFAKGKFVFAKTVNRTVTRIRSLANPAPLSQIYAKGYYLLLALMFFLGYIVRFLPLDIRGGVDVIIGSALLNGSILYFRQAYAVARS